MLMYIDKITVYAPANNKCRELGLWADERYSNCLTDGRTLDRILYEIRRKMAALDEQYPRTRRMNLNIYASIGSATKIYANIDGTTDQKAVFIMTVHRVETRYLWSDTLNTPMYYGRQEEEEFRRACERKKEGGAE